MKRCFVFNAFTRLKRYLFPRHLVNEVGRKAGRVWRNHDPVDPETDPLGSYTRDHFIEVFMTDGSSQLIVLHGPDTDGGAGG